MATSLVPEGEGGPLEVGKSQSAFRLMSFWEVRQVGVGCGVCGYPMMRAGLTLMITAGT